MSQIAIEKLQNTTGNIYEAVVIMAKRARQINDDQKMLIDMEMEHTPQMDNKESEDFDEVEIDREALMREHKRYPKPSTLAIHEMIEGKIEHRYINPEENEKE